MNDLISRQAAIEELEWGAWGKEYDKALAKAMLESLPSAQMDLPCVGCRYERKGSVVCDDCSRFFMDRYERRAEE